MMLETLIILLCFDPEVNSIKQKHILEGNAVEVVTSKPEEVCYYVASETPLIF